MQRDECNAACLAILAGEHDTKGRVERLLQWITQRTGFACSWLLHQEGRVIPWTCDGFAHPIERALEAWSPPRFNEPWRQFDSNQWGGDANLVVIRGDELDDTRMDLVWLTPQPLDAAGMGDCFIPLRSFLKIVHQQWLHEGQCAWREERQERLQSGDLAERRSLADWMLRGESQAIASFRVHLTEVASHEAPVWVYGPAGSLHPVVAWMLHDRTFGARAPFVRVSGLERMSESMALNELFGTVSRGETGYRPGRQGLLEMANGGTLWLENPERWPEPIQEKLAQILRRQHVRRLGSGKEQAFRLRLVATSSAPLDEWKGKGFWSDLWGVLFSEFSLRIPGLEERKEDIEILLTSFPRWTETGTRNGGIPSGSFSSAAESEPVLSPWSPESLKSLQAHTWPENYLEFQRVCSQALLLVSQNCGEEPLEVQAHHLDGLISVSTEPTRGTVTQGTTYKQTIDAFRRQVISRVLDSHQGNWAQAARELGMDRGNLHRLAQRLGVTESERETNGSETV